jgi:glyoxylase-like metal-dependent hydrolase (beta-lactamase superfamily II)
VVAQDAAAVAEIEAKGMTRTVHTTGLALGVLVAVSVAVGAQQTTQIRTPKQAPLPRTPDWAKMEVETLHVQGQVHMIAGAGGNIAVQVGNTGVLMVDTGYEQMSGKVLAAIRKISGDRTLRTIINTTLSDAHTGGNAVFVKEGRLNQAGPGLGQRPNEADLIGHSSLLALMTEIGREKIAVERWPPSVFSGKQKDLYSNDEPVVILQVADAATSGDAMVWFRKSDVIATGEIFNQATFPYIDVAHGGTINGIIEGLNMVLDMTVPKHNQEGGTLVIPGYGRIGDEHDVLEYRDMVTIIRDRVQAAVSKKMTLAQVKAMKPSATYEYELRFNRDPAWTAEMFVEAIYTNLTARK